MREPTEWYPGPSESLGDTAQAFKRLGAKLWPCILCGKHFRRDPLEATNGELVHCVTAKKVVDGETVQTDLPWDPRLQYIIVYACSNKCAWWKSQYMRQRSDMIDVRLYCYRYVGMRREDVLP